MTDQPTPDADKSEPIAALPVDRFQPIELRGIDGFIDEMSDLGPSPLTPHGRDCVRTILLAFAAHVKRQLTQPTPDAAKTSSQRWYEENILEVRKTAKSKC